MTTRTYFKRGDHVTSTAYPGIAMWFLNYDVMHFHSAECEYEGCYGGVTDTDTAVVQMVGDDRKITVGADTLSAIDREDFCGGCGQMGCGHG